MSALYSQIGEKLATEKEPFCTIFLTGHRVPPNCSFEIDDAEQDWLFEPNSFDFIHNRNFVCAIRNWERLVGQAFR